jgi:hypothetical protein
MKSDIRDASTRCFVGVHIGAMSANAGPIFCEIPAQQLKAFQPPM